MTNIKRILLLVFISIFITGCGGDSDDSQPNSPVTNTTIVDVAASNDEFSTLVSLLESTGLVETLDGTDNFTVFAPTNAAFAALGDDTLNALANDPEALSDILLYHVVPGVIDSNAAIASAGTQVETANGSAVAITAGGTGVGVRVNLSNITAVDISADNGLIHVIDRVMLPPTPTDLSGNSITTIARTNTNLSTLVVALQAAGLDSVLADLNSGSSFTVFAPTNDAFAAIDSDVLTRLLGDADALQAVLLQHVVADAAVDSVTAMTLAGTNVSTAGGNGIAVDIVEGELTVGGAKVIATDIIAENGIIHLIDQVIIGEVEIPEPSEPSTPPGNEQGEELTANPGFDDGLTGWVASPSVTIGSEDGNSYASAAVSEAGTAFSVNISQVLTLEAGAEYVLSFRARATQERSIIAGIGFNFAPFYANVEEVALSTEWQEFTLTLAAIDDGTGEDLGGANNRILFDLGAAVGDVHIDDVSLRKIGADNGGGSGSTPSLDGYTLVWSDEFDGPSINTENWGFQLGDGTEAGIPGWGNQELQIYTSDEANASIGLDEDNSVLMITAREDGEGGYTSARLNSSGKVSIRYGKIVGRMKLPETQGLWPAFWTLGDATEVIWPGIGEIDIMELTGDTPNKTFHTVHYVNGEQRYNFIGQDFFNDEKFSDGYNEFMIDWTPENITWYVNGEQAFQLPITEDMQEFKRSHHLLLNVAVGGNLPGNPDGTSVFPQTMYVDYVRVYEKDGFTPDPEPPVDINEETVGGAAGEADISQAIQAGFNDLGTSLTLNRFGAGGEPSWSNSDDAIDGSQSVQFAYPGGAFGGAWMTSETPIDLTVYASGDLIFAIKKPTVVANLEVKLEGADGSAASMFVVNYTATDLGNGWEEYRIPMADIANEGLSIDQVTIPFALWNPVDADGNFPEVNILFDTIRFE
jgi:uncharacterized surface protein with fasciclin (FAS1) repeats/beta-glucanase (GH16 family)